MNDARIPCAILGAAGYIGQHFARLLADHPWFDPPVLVGSDRSVGATLSDRWLLAEPAPVQLERERIRARTPAQLARAGVRLVFSALPSGSARPVELAFARRGVAVFSNAADHRRAPGVPLLVPEVNGPHLSVLPRARGRAPVITNPNCTATGLVLALAPLRDLVRPRAVHVSTYQSISGAGFPGVPALSVADNVVPFIDGEEEKVAEESAWILGTPDQRLVRPAQVPILAHCARVGTREGHLEAVTIEATRRPSLAEVLAGWRNFDPLRAERLPTAPSPPVELRSERDRPQPLADRWAGDPARARGMAVVVGRVRWTPPYLRFFLLSHNAVRGGAGGSVLNAEFALRHRVLDGLAAPDGS